MAQPILDSGNSRTPRQNGFSNVFRSYQRETPVTQTIPAKKTKKNFVYMDELSIDADLTCSICLDPFDDPVSTPCDHTFCRECIERSIKCNSDRACPTCRRGPLSNNNLTPANRIIRNKVDRYTVKCLVCNQTNIIRGDFQEHANKLCSKANVSCPAAKVRCPWTGPRDELKGHQLSCLYKQLQPILNELLSSNEKMQEQINIQATQLRKMSEEIDRQTRPQSRNFFKCTVEFISSDDDSDA